MILIKYQSYILTKVIDMVRGLNVISLHGLINIQGNNRGLWNYGEERYIPLCRGCASCVMLASLIHVNFVVTLIYQR